MVCRMCLQNSDSTLGIFDENPSIIAPTIARHFWFEPSKDDTISTLICICCWSQIETFHLYYLSVEEAQRRLTEHVPAAEIKEEVDYVKNELGDDAGIKNESQKCDEPDATTTCNFEFIGHDYKDSDDDDDGGGIDDDGDPEFGDPGDDFDTSDDEPLKTLKSESKLSASKKGHDSKPENDETMKSEENDATHSNESKPSSLPKRRGRKRKQNAEPKKSPPADSEHRKKMNEYDEEIARQTTLRCDLCTSEFKLFAEMQRHYRAVHKIKGYAVCCSAKFYNRSTFFNHMIKHVAPERLKCDKCDKLFSNKRALQNHSLIYHEPADIKIFHCDQCPKRYAKKYQLNHHKKTHLEKNSTNFTCDECGKGFSNKYALSAHKRGIHESAYCRMCDICAKVLRSRALFEKHKLEHDGIFEPRAQCPICERWLKNDFRLKLHMKTHNRSDGDNFECNECGKIAPSKAALQSHVRYVHQATRMYQCSYCDKAFKKPVTLKEHMTTHTGDVLYTCPHCPKTFNSRANMHSHRKKKHREEWEETRKTRGMPDELRPTIAESETSFQDDANSQNAGQLQITIMVEDALAYSNS